MADSREWSEAELMEEKPRGELLVRTDGGELVQLFVCHGCQSCWLVDPVTDELEEAYPHLLEARPVVEVTV